jgi:hypothetical protein
MNIYRYRDTERDAERERRNNEAIRRKYLGQSADQQTLSRQWQQPALTRGRVWDVPIAGGIVGSSLTNG